MLRSSTALFIAIALVTGCATVKLPEDKQRMEVAELAKKLQGLSSSVDANEAARASDAAIRYPLRLAEQYRARSPAVINNIFINAGLRPRGLCFQWADDLTAKLMTLHLHTLELHRGVAHLGTKHEHSCVVLTAHGQNFTNGIALDAWRHCGRLHWSPVTKDKFVWQEVDLTAPYQAELQAAASALEAQLKQP